MQAKEFRKKEAPFLTAIRERRLSCLSGQKADSAFEHYYATLPKRFIFDDLLAHQNSSGENILHLIALSSDLAGVLEVISVESSDEAIKAAVIIKNSGEETPFHLACRYLNLPLFEFILNNSSSEDLKEIASVVVNEGGFNAGMMLVVAAFNNAVLPLRDFFQNELPPGLWSQQSFESMPISGEFPIFITRLKEILGVGLDDLLLVPDWFGNTVLLLACLTRNDQFIQDCISAFTDPLKFREAVVATLPGNRITPFKILCAFGSAKTLHILFAKLRGDDNYLTQLCLSQDALGWCYKTRLETKNDLENAKRLDLVARAYGDKLECGAIANEERPSLLVSDVEGILVRKILTKIPSVDLGRRHYYVQNRLVFELFCTIKSQFLSDPLKLLVDDLFKISWPRATIMGMSDALLKKMGQESPTESNLKAAMLEIIMTHKKPFIYIPFALFYKVEEPLNQMESQYVDRFQKDDRMLRGVMDFCQSSTVSCIERILVSRSLLKSALFKKLGLNDYDNEVSAATDKLAVKARYLGYLEACLLPKPNAILEI